MKGDTEVTLPILFGIFGLYIGLVLSAERFIPFITSFAPPLATLLAAFAGSWYAFRLHQQRDEKVLAQTRIRTVNQTLFELARHRSRLITIKQMDLNPHRDDPYRHLRILPLHKPHWSAPDFDYDALSFLLDKETQGLFSELAQAQDLTAQALDILRSRSKNHIENIQTTLELLEKEEGKIFDLSSLQDRLSSRDATTIKKDTDSLFTAVDLSIAHIDQATQQLRKTAEKFYPDRTFLEEPIFPSQQSGQLDR